MQNNNNLDIVYLEVPFHLKEDAKKLGAKYDVELKRWYTYSDNYKLIDEYSIVYLNIDYNKKEEVKQLGGKWNIELKKWYTYSSNYDLVY